MDFWLFFMVLTNRYKKMQCIDIDGLFKTNNRFIFQNLHFKSLGLVMKFYTRQQKAFNPYPCKPAGGWWIYPNTESYLDKTCRIL